MPRHQCQELVKERYLGRTVQGNGSSLCAMRSRPWWCGYLGVGEILVSDDDTAPLGAAFRYMYVP